MERDSPFWGGSPKGKIKTSFGGSWSFEGFRYGRSERRSAVSASAPRNDVHQHDEGDNDRRHDGYHGDGGEGQQHARSLSRGDGTALPSPDAFREGAATPLGTCGRMTNG
jgi:hypothetical protein